MAVPYVGWMADTGPHLLSIDDALAALTFLPDRTPTTNEESSGAFKRLAEYRDGAIFVGHWAGSSEWERHPVGDEIVMVVDGETTISFFSDSGDVLRFCVRANWSSSRRGRGIASTPPTA